MLNNSLKTKYEYVLLAILFCVVLADIADYRTVPKGSNPTLFDSANDLVIQLDDSTFNDTIFCSNRGENCSSFMVMVFL